MFRWLTRRLAAWRARAETERARGMIDGRTLADLGLSRAAVNAALGGHTGLLARQRFD